MALGACTWACHVHGQPWPWLLAHWRVIFPKKVFFFFFFPSLNGGYLCKPTCLCLSSVPTGVASPLLLAYGCCLDLSYMLQQLWPCPWVLGACTQATCPWGLPQPWLLAQWRIILPNEGFFQKNVFFSKKFIWASQHAFALALAVCPQGLPWPLLLSYRGFLGFNCVTQPCCLAYRYLNLGCVPLPWLLPPMAVFMALEACTWA